MTKKPIHPRGSPQVNAKLTPEESEGLDWAARVRGVPRAELVRQAVAREVEITRASVGAAS